MRLFDKLYRVVNRLNMDASFFNTRFRSVDDRLHALEEVKGSLQAETERLSKIAIEQVTDMLAETANISLGLASLGSVLSVKSYSTFSIQQGEISLVVDEADRAKVPSSAFIAAVPLGIDGASVAGVMTEWNENTGVLTFHGMSVVGEGRYSEWVVGLSAPNTDYNPNEVPASTKDYVDLSISQINSELTSLSDEVNSTSNLITEKLVPIEAAVAGQQRLIQLALLRAMNSTSLSIFESWEGGFHDDISSGSLDMGLSHAVNTNGGSVSMTDGSLGETIIPNMTSNSSHPSFPFSFSSTLSNPDYGYKAFDGDNSTFAPPVMQTNTMTLEVAVPSPVQIDGVQVSASWNSAQSYAAVIEGRNSATLEWVEISSEYDTAGAISGYLNGAGSHDRTIFFDKFRVTVTLHDSPMSIRIRNFKPVVRREKFVSVARDSVIVPENIRVMWAARAISPNDYFTDDLFEFEVSRDDGVTWLPVACSLIGQDGDGLGTRAFFEGAASFTDQPSGTDLRYRLAKKSGLSSTINLDEVLILWD